MEEEDDLEVQIMIEECTRKFYNLEKEFIMTGYSSIRSQTNELYWSLEQQARAKVPYVIPLSMVHRLLWRKTTAAINQKRIFSKRRSIDKI